MLLMTDEELELIRRIASVVGHELRNPLAVINNSAYFLKAKLGEGGRLDPKVEKHLGIVGSEIGRLNGMIEDILVFSRPMKPEKKPLALGAIAASVVAACAAPDAVKIELKAAKKGLDVEGDERLLSDALRRLLDNAVQALEAGGKVTVTVEAKADAVEAAVADSGKGFSPDALKSFGQAFSTTKPRGLGLGLAMARKIAQAHGGSLSGGNAPKGGAVVRLALPRHA